MVDAKPLDPRSTTYEKKVYDRKKKAERLGDVPEDDSKDKGKKGGRGMAGAKSELRSVEDIRKKRQQLEQVSRFASMR